MEQNRVRLATRVLKIILQQIVDKVKKESLQKQM